MDANAIPLKKSLPCGALVALSLLFLFTAARRQTQLTHPLVGPMRHPDIIHRPAASTEKRGAKKTPAVAAVDSMNLQRFGLHQYLVNFEGLATYQGKPCANASILIRISTVNGSQAIGIITKSDGTYARQILVDSMPNEPIDWIVEGYTPEFKNVEIVGRRIGTEDDDPIGVEQEVAFLNR